MELYEELKKANDSIRQFEKDMHIMKETEMQNILLAALLKKLAELQEDVNTIKYKMKAI